MKTRAFIGSSVEGLNIAYAVQQNLLHDAEITVWDQGVFEPSGTTIESLVKALATNDFGIFVFSPDDIQKMRGKEDYRVRDNVLFEFGLFVGKLGRERVFFLTPSGQDMHIPTDLLGVNPGRYETTRTDGSMQAATAPACHQIRQQINKLGVIQSRQATGGEETAVVAAAEVSWAVDFFERKYDCAKPKIEAELRKAEPNKNQQLLQICLHYCEFKNDSRGGIQPLLQYAESQPEPLSVRKLIAAILKMDQRYSDAISLLKDIKKDAPGDELVDLAIAKCHAANEEQDIAISILEAANPSQNKVLALALADLLEQQGRNTDAFEVIKRCYWSDPTTEQIRYKYARLAQDLSFHEIAVYLLDRLTIDFPDSIEYWGYLGNSCLALDLIDKSLIAYRKAEILMKPDDTSQWIVSNIGNLLSHTGLPSEACIYLERALKNEPKSDYAHDRMSTALKSIQEKQKLYQSKCAEGFRQIRDAMKQVSLPS
jgi:tetratricopeptide (TPR) repeat protein